MFRFRKKKDPSLRDEYIGWVIAYCDEYACLHHMKERIEDGEAISTHDLSDLNLILKRLSAATEALKKAKSAMGYEDGLVFLENNAFKDFSIVNGQLIGNPKEAYQIVSPWYFDYVSGKSNNHYTFEVATLVSCLADKCNVA